MGKSSMERDRAASLSTGLGSWVLVAILFQSSTASLASTEVEQKKYPKNPGSSYLAEHHFSLAQAYSADGNVEKAIEEYKLTLAFDPKSAVLYGKLATEYVKKGMLAAAMEACKAALQLDSKFT